MRTGLCSLFLVAAIAGCGGSPDVATSDVSHEDDLSARDFDTAVQQLTATPWLPWTYLRGGCDARAGYYSMLLASMGIPSNQIYVLLALPNVPLLAERWQWHVAPMVTKDGDTEHLWVLDPAFDSKKAITSIEWVAKMGYADPAAKNYPLVSVLPAYESGVPVAAGSNPMSHPGTPDVARYREPSLDKMEGFDMGGVNDACATMHEYIDLEETTTAKEKAAKHRALGRETQRLVANLTEKKLVVYDRSQNHVPDELALNAACTRGEPAP